MLALLPVVLAFALVTAAARSPDGKVYGVNLGSWLVLEPWMLPQGWIDMGGESCDDCSTCIASEFAFAKAYPSTVDGIFNQHWTTWFTQDDVNDLKDLGLNTVRIPLGYWIVEPLVDRSTEFFPRGGIRQLKRGLKQLKNSGIAAILDHHALPGVQTSQQMFTGRCTRDVQFYTPENYHRALIWTAVMTALSHMDPDFSSVFSIQAVNEPEADASKTPGYGDFQKNFVFTLRAVEVALGIPIPGVTSSDPQRSPPANVSDAMVQAARDPSMSGEVGQALLDAAPVLLQVVKQLGIGLGVRGDVGREALVTNFMDISWQRNNPANPADAKIGPQAYDNHLYYSFGGVADANPDAYMRSICKLSRVQTDAALDNTPFWFGEWALSTQFSATDKFLFQWADAQKRAFSAGAGWIFWNFKIEISDLAGDTARQWSYFEGVKRGYFTKDPSQLHDPHVCDKFIASSGESSTDSPQPA